jgi:hypothetical protein
MNGQKITGLANGTAATDAAAFGQIAGVELSYTQITAPAAVTDTVEATATALISPGAFTPNGNPILAEFFSPNIVMPTGAGATMTITLFEGATEIGRLCSIVSPATGTQFSAVGKLRFTPTNAAHTYKVCAFISSALGGPAIGAGAGGTGVLVPAYIRFTQV